MISRHVSPKQRGPMARKSAPAAFQRLTRPTGRSRALHCSLPARRSAGDLPLPLQPLDEAPPASVQGEEGKRSASGSQTGWTEEALAQPPDMSETFVREVDENLRRDQLRDFFKAYGNWLIAALVLFLAASGGFIWWKQHQVQQHEAEVEQLAQVYKGIGSGNASQAPQQLDQLSK